MPEAMIDVDLAYGRDGLRVSLPAGHVITTEAFRRFVEAAPTIADLVEHLSRTGPDDREGVRARAI